MPHKRHPIFNGLNPAYSLLSKRGAEILVKSGFVVKNYKKGEKIVAQGSVVNHAFSLRDGIVCAAHPVPDREEDLIVTTAYLQKDIVIPYFITQGISPIDLLSVGPTTIVEFPAKAFLEAIKESPDFSFWLLEYQAKRLARNHFLRISTTLATIEARIVHFFWLISDAMPDGRRIVRIKVPQQILGSYLSISRGVVNRHKKNLERSGYLKTTPEGILLSHECTYLMGSYSSIPAPWEAFTPKMAVTT